ncbi:MAG: helix-turn-helix domain-containing protein [Atopobiaceae bacterium]|nr:helix-turn-helix domain-containing protein [Atopobiaceae bacterium]
MHDDQKAAFHAIRELTGMTQSALAAELGVEVRSVKRWESPRAPQLPPPDAWDVVAKALSRQREVVRFALDKVHDVTDEQGAPPCEVCLPYWSGAEDYEQHSTDAALGVTGDWRMANANTRALATALWAEGVRVTWSATSPARMG